MKIDSDIPLVHFVLTTLKNLDMVWTVWKDVLVHGREIVKHGKMYKTTSVYKWTQMDVFKWTSKSVVRSNHNGFTLYDNCVRVYSEHSCICVVVHTMHIGLNGTLWTSNFSPTTTTKMPNEFFVHFTLKAVVADNVCSYHSIAKIEILCKQSR